MRKNLTCHTKQGAGMYQKLILLLTLALLLAACQNTSEPGKIINPPTNEPHPTSQPQANEDTQSSISSLQSPTLYFSQTNCSDNGSGSADQPFCDFDVAVSHLQPGDTLIIQDGEYNGRYHIENLQGNPNAPITIRGQSREGAIFDGGCPHFPCPINEIELATGDDDETGLINLLNSQHIILQNLTLQNSIGAGLSINNGSDITIQDTTISGTGNPGLLAQNVDGLAILRNDISYATMGYLDENGDLQIGAHEALSILASNDFKVVNNYVHDTPKEGIDVKESSTNGIVQTNKIERTCLVGLYINEAHFVTIHGNQIHQTGYFLDGDTLTTCDNHPIFGDLYDDYYGNGIQLAVGDLGDRSKGYLSDIHIIQNTVWDVMGNGLEFWDELRESSQGEGEMTDNLVANNVFYRAQLGGIRLQDVGSSTIVNNIIALTEEDPITGDHQDQNSISHNLFSPQYDWQKATGDDAILADPLFVDAENGDFHLQPSSPAIDAGTDWGIDYTGTAPDIGAFELGEVSIETSEENSESMMENPSIVNQKSSIENISTWLYLIDVNLDQGTVNQIADSSYDMVVLDYIPSESYNTDYPMARVIDHLHNADHPKRVIAYIDIGEAESYRTYWQDGWGIGNPEWIITGDPDGWDENYPVAYWYDEWQKIWLDKNGLLQGILDVGFDGIYLDWVEAYSDEDVAAKAQQENLDPVQEMIWFVGDIGDFGRAQNPDFLVIAQNAAELAERDDYVDIIDAIAQEQVWFDGGADNKPPGDCPLPATDADIETDDYVNSLSPECRRQHDEFPESTLHVSSEEYLQYLIMAQDKGLPIFTVDYALQKDNVQWVLQTSREHGFIPFVGSRALDGYVPPK
jgi:uncharacterized protein (TIGR01370 family)